LSSILSSFFPTQTMAEVSSQPKAISGSKRCRSREREIIYSPATKRRRARSNALAVSSSYEDYVCTNLMSLIQDAEVNDVTFIVENEEFYGIRALFAAQSIVFKNMLYGSMMESNPNNEVILNDVTIPAFKYLRSTFCNVFTDKQSALTSKIVVDVLFAAQKYLIHPLIEKCINYIKQMQEIDAWYSVLSQFEKSTFQHQSKLYLTQILNEGESPYVFEYRSLKFLQNARFMSLSAETVVILLNSDYLAAKEHEIWDALIRWTKHNGSALVSHSKPITMNTNSNSHRKEAKEQKEQFQQDDFKDTEQDNEEQTHQERKREEEPEEEEEEVMNRNLSERERKLISTFIPFIRFNQMEANYLKENIVDKQILSSSDIINIMFAREDNTKWKSAFNDKQRQKSKLMDTFQLSEVCLSLKQIKALQVGDLVDFRDLYGLFCPASILEVDHSQNKIKVHYNNWGSTYDEWYFYLASSSSSSSSPPPSSTFALMVNQRENDNADIVVLDDREQADERQEEANNNTVSEEEERGIAGLTDRVVMSQRDRNYRIAQYGSITNRQIKREYFKSKVERFKNILSSESSSYHEIEVNLPMWFWKKNENYIENKQQHMNKWTKAKIVGYKTATKYSHHVKIGVYINDDHYEYWIHPDNEDEIRPASHYTLSNTDNAQQW